MSSAAEAVSRTPPSFRHVAMETLREESARWGFVLRAVLSLYLAGWLAMRLELPQPSTVMMTTVIVMNRQSGMVLAKSFYRALGTLGGAIAAVAMMALFPPEPALLLPALALWVGVCAGGALLYRNFKAYGFVLAGYTATIVLMPAIADPLVTFASAVNRVSEVLLGILVAAIVNDTVLPSRMRDSLRQAAFRQFANFMTFVGGSTAGTIPRAAMEKAHLRFVGEAIALEDLRSSVVFEDADARARSGQIRSFNQRFMAASTTFQSVHHLINRLQRGGHARTADALIELYRPLGEALAVPVEAGQGALALLPRLEAARARMAANIAPLRARLDAAEGIDYDTGAALLQRFAEELHAYTDLGAKLNAPRLVAAAIEKARFVRSNDFLSAGIAALHTALTLLLLGLFWVESAWPSGATAMFIASMFCGLLAATPNPATQAIKTMEGWGLGIAVSFVCTLFVLPKVDGYALLIAATLPFFMIAPYLATYPRWASLGTGYGVQLIYGFALANPMHYDPVRFLNDALATMVGLGVAALAFLIVPAATGSGWFLRRQFAQLRRQVAFATQAPLPGLLHRFESVNRDLLHQILAHTPQAHSGSILSWALAVHETGRAVIELRRDIATLHLDSTLREASTAAMQCIAYFYERPGAARHASALDATLEAIDLAQTALPGQPEFAPLLHHLNLLRMALLDDESAVAAYRPNASSAPPEAAHAS